MARVVPPACPATLRLEEASAQPASRGARFVSRPPRPLPAMLKQHQKQQRQYSSVKQIIKKCPFTKVRKPWAESIIAIDAHLVAAE